VVPELRSEPGNDLSSSVPLSPREAQVCVVYADGFTANEIARVLGISVENVEQRIRHAKVKYRIAGRTVHTKMELRQRLIEDGLLRE
jgi:DNA-binding CsgD family transcriptional regulator